MNIIQVNLSKGVKKNVESSGEQNGESLLKNQTSSINSFVSQLSHTIVEFMYRSLDLLLLIFLIVIVNVCNDYIKDVLAQFFLKFICVCVIIFVRIKLIEIIYQYMLNTDKRKLVSISGLILVLNIICFLCVFNIIDESIISSDRLIICLTVPLLIMNISIIVNSQSMVPLVIIMLAFIAGIVVFTLVFFIDFGSWKSSLQTASVVYIIFGLFCVIKLLLHYFLNSESKNINDAKKVDNVKADVNDSKADVSKGVSDANADVGDNFSEIKGH